MEDGLTEYQQRLVDRYLPHVKETEKGLLFGLAAGPKEFGFENEMLAFLMENPEATLSEIEEYAEQFFPELVVEDD